MGSHATILTLLAGIVATCGVAVRIVTEESLDADAYPEYRAYAKRTKRIIPFLL